VLMVDYLQLLKGTGNGKDNRVQEVSEITQGLKAIAKELNIPVIALSQLSRTVESREDKRPQLSDLRESGSIEQDADVVMFVYRDEYYKEREKPGDHELEKMAAWQQLMEQVHGKAEVIIGKQRHGPIGHVELAFEGQFTRFSDLARNWQGDSHDSY
jgi:replicative DNA helicase